MARFQIFLASHRGDPTYALPPAGRAHSIKRFVAVLLAASVLVGGLLAALFIGSIIAALLVILVALAAAVATLTAAMRWLRR